MITKKQAKLALSYLPPVEPGEDTNTIEEIVAQQGMRVVMDYGDSLVLAESRHGEKWVLGGDGRREYVVAVLLLEGWEKFIEEAHGV